MESTADQIIDPSNILPKEMGEIPILQGLIQSQEGTILLLNWITCSSPSMPAPYWKRSIRWLKAWNKAVQPKMDVSQSVGDALQAAKPGESCEKRAEVPPAKYPRARSRKKADASPEITDEVAV